MSDDWRSYPYRLVPGDSRLDFPAAEGEHPDQESDTWFIAGELEAAHNDRSFAFLTIFNKNRPGGSIVADFYTLALFDLDTGAYGTYTDYDMPPANLRPAARSTMRPESPLRSRPIGLSPGPSCPRPRAISTSATTATPARRRGRRAAKATPNCCRTPTA